MMKSRVFNKSLSPLSLSQQDKNTVDKLELEIVRQIQSARRATENPGGTMNQTNTKIKLICSDLEC